jgi:Cu2+-exporting ATPase
VFLDKTGTLTEPGLAVVEWHGDTSIREPLAILEAMVSHPVARAIAAERTDDARQSLDAQLVRSARQGIVGTVGGATIVAGSEAYVLRELAAHDQDHPALAPEWATLTRQALTGKGLTPVWVSRGNDVIAVIGIGSRLRDDATKTLQMLRARGLLPVILSGDDPETVRHLGEQLEISAERCHGGLSPEDKLRMVQHACLGRAAIMVGDGVNDAAALSAANVGIAVHGGAEASLAAADVYLGRPGIGVLVELLESSARTIAVIRRCLRVSLAYNIVAAGLAVTGVISPLIAAILMPLASFTVLGIALLSKTFSVDSAAAKIGTAPLRQPEPQVAN